MGVFKTIGNALTGGIGSLVGGLASGGLNLVSQYMTNKANQQMAQEANAITLQNNAWQKENFEKQLQWQKDQYFDQESYSRALQQELFNREDTSYQRTINDITASGLSPLAINGTNDSGSVVAQANVPNASIPELSGINPFQAQSLNFGQLADILARADERAIDRERNEIEEKKYLSDKEQRELDRKQEQEQFEAKLNQAQSQFDQSMQQRQVEFESTNKQKAEELKLEQQRINTMNEQLKLEQDKEITRKIEKQLQGLTGGRGHTKRYTDKEAYEKAFKAWKEGYTQQLSLAALSLKQATLQSGNRNESKSVGSQAVLSASYSEGSGNTTAYGNQDEAVNAELLEWLVKNPLPVYY